MTLQLSMRDNIKSLTFVLITKLGQYPIRLDQLWKKKYRVLLNKINNIMIFSSRYYTYLKAFLYSIVPKQEGTKVIA